MRAARHSCSIRVESEARVWTPNATAPLHPLIFHICLIIDVMIEIKRNLPRCREWPAILDVVSRSRQQLRRTCHFANSHHGDAESYLANPSLFVKRLVMSSACRFCFISDSVSLPLQFRSQSDRCHPKCVIIFIQTRPQFIHPCQTDASNQLCFMRVILLNFSLQ